MVRRSEDADSGKLLRREADGRVFSSEGELAKGVAVHVLARFERPAGAAEASGKG